MTNELPNDWANADPAGPWLPVGGEGDAYRGDDGHLLVHTGEPGEYIEAGEPVEVRL